MTRHNAKCEAYGAPCSNTAKRLVEVKDGKGGWRTMIFCNCCCENLIRDCAEEIASGEIKVRF